MAGRLISGKRFLISLAHPPQPGGGYMSKSFSRKIIPQLVGHPIVGIHTSWQITPKPRKIGGNHWKKFGRLPLYLYLWGPLCTPPLVGHPCTGRIQLSRNQTNPPAHYHPRGVIPGKILVVGYGALDPPHARLQGKGRIGSCHSQGDHCPPHGGGEGERK